MSSKIKTVNLCESGEQLFKNFHDKTVKKKNNSKLWREFRSGQSEGIFG